MSRHSFQHTTRRLKASVLGLLLALFLTGAGLPPLPVQAQDRQSMKELESKQKTLEQKARALQAKKNEKLRQARTVQSKIIQNQQRLSQTNRSLNYEQYKLRVARSNLVSLSQNIDKTFGEKERLASDAGSRLKALYTGERISFLQMILDAHDMMTLLDRLYYKQKMVAQDKKLLTDLHRKISLLNAQKSRVRQQQQQIDGTIRNIASYKLQIEQNIKVDSALKHRLETDARFYEQAERQLLRESESIERLLSSHSSQYKQTNVATATGIFTWPLSGRVTSYYGYRNHPIHRKRLMHTGLDIAGPHGAAIRAADGGEVIFAGWRGGYGKVVMINHGIRNGKNLVTLYGHMSSWDVSTGQTVSKGQVVGRVGSTGYATGPHLHFETREDGKTVDPQRYL